MKMLKSLDKGLLLAGASSFVLVAAMSASQAAHSQEIDLNAVQANQEFASPIGGTAVAGGLPFQISVDGVPIDGSLGSAEDDQRTVDVAFDRMDIQMTFDGLNLRKSLNLTTNKAAYAPGERVNFRGYWNYGAFIERAEVRIFDANGSVDVTPLAVLDLPQSRVLDWEYPEGLPGQVQVVLRVFGKNGNFDETTPKLLATVSQPAEVAGDYAGAEVETLAGYDEDSLDTSGIAVTGGTVTVFGTDVPDGNSVYVLGSPVPVDPNGRFVAAEILPSGDHNVAIAVLDTQGQGLEFQRNLFIPGTDLFYVGLGDFTVGTGRSSGPTELVGENSEWGEIYTSARVAAFVRGKVADNIFVTAQADTGEAPIDEIFVNFLDRDPSKVTNRLDTFETYNTFGDDSSIERIVNSQGKFYVEVEQGRSRAVWGNYQTNINGPVFASVNRSRYGANISYRSEGQLQTPNGESVIEADAFFAQQGTIGHRDNMRGTGGSVYFLTYQDIQRGGERVSVEVRDTFSGIVVSKAQLTYGEDYDLDSIQGRIILNEALPSSNDQGEVYLVVDYEYTPKGFDQYKDLFYGGRLVGRLGDFVTVGVTGLVDENSASGRDRQLLGADVGLSFGGASFVRAEVAQTSGDPSAEFGSDDGGYTFADDAAVTGVDGALGYRIEGAIDSRDFTDAVAARIGAYYQHRDAGFSAVGSSTAINTDEFGASASVGVGPASINASYDNRTTDDGLGTVATTQQARVGVAGTIGPVSAGVGLGWSQDAAGDSSTSVNGNVGYTLPNDWRLGVNGSTTISSTNGVGGSSVGASIDGRITDRLTVGGSVDYSFDDDISAGDVSASVRTAYVLDDRTQLSLGYSLSDVTNNSTGAGTLSGDLNFGFKRQLTDGLNFYVEERLSHRGTSVEGLTHMFGVDYTPDEAWQFAVNAEVGDVNNLSRRAVSLNGGYRTEGVSVGGALEYRWEDDNMGAIRQTYVGKANVGFEISEDWRAQGDLNVVLSEQNGNFIDGNFIQGTIGAAYRPVDNNRFNGLFRYTFLYDLPTDTNANLFGADGTIGSSTSYKQRSHILEADGIWQINDQFSLGAKYGVRLGEVTTSRNSDVFFGDTIHLGIARVDWHVVRNWDALVEGRVLYQQDTGSTRLGAVAAVYRHFGDNFKVGVGYNFGAFNDDLTDVSYDSQGLFLNAIAKF